MEPATRQLIYVSRDPSAELNTRFHQRGWHVEYQEYTQVQGHTLPVRLTLERDAVHIKVAVSEWSLPAPAP